MILTIIMSIIVAIFIFGIVGAVGKKILDYFQLNIPEQEKVLFAVVIGSGILSLLLFFLGIFHLYYSVTLMLFILCALVLWNKQIFWVLSTVTKIIKEVLTVNGSIFIKICKFILFFFILLNLLFSLTPEIQWDSLVYHLAVPKIYAKEHSIVEISYDYHSYFPKQIEMIYLFGESLHLVQFSKIFTTLFNMLLFLGVYCYCRDRWNKRIGIIAATIIYTIPIMAIYQSTTYNDIAMTLFLWYASIAFFKAIALRKDSTLWLYVCGFLIGCASVTKIIAMSMLGFFGIISFVYMVHQSLRKRIFNLCIIVLMCFFVLSPWMTLTYVQTGNPTYPFFYTHLGGDNWTLALEDFWQDLRKEYGTGRSIASFLVTPWNLTMHPMLYGPIYGYTPLFLLCLPLFLLLVLSHSFNDKQNLFFLLFIGYYYIVWFLLASDGRYIFPIFPAATVLSTITLFYFWQSKKKIYGFLIPAIFILIFISNILLFAIMNRDAVQVLIGMQTNSEYIQEHVQNYELAQWVNKNLEDTSLLFIANDDRGYYFEKNYILGYPIIQGYIDYFEFDSADKLRARLKREGVTHIVLTYHHTSEGTTLTIFNNFYNSCITKIWLDLVEEHGEFIIEKNNVYLYKLV